MEGGGRTHHKVADGVVDPMQHLAVLAIRVQRLHARPLHAVCVGGGDQGQPIAMRHHACATAEIMKRHTRTHSYRISHTSIAVRA